MVLAGGLEVRDDVLVDLCDEVKKVFFVLSVGQGLEFSGRDEAGDVPFKVEFEEEAVAEAETFVLWEVIGEEVEQGYQFVDFA